jgi:hypothetical protein
MPSVATSIVTPPPKDASFSIGECRYAFLQEFGKQTPFFATSPPDAVLGTNEPGNAIGLDVGNPTPSVATTKDAMFSAGDNTDATVHA